MKTRRRPFLPSLCLLSLLYALAFSLAPTAYVQQDSAKATVQTKGGLQIVTFDTLNGQVIVNLPDDIMAGDTISGTVMAEPKGQTNEERAKNMAVLSGYVIELETPKKPDGTSNPKVKAQVTAVPSPFSLSRRR